MQHVQVRRRKSIRLLKTGNGNVSWPLAAPWAASSHPLTDFGFSGRQLKLQWGEAEILITWRITVFTVRGIFTIIHIGTFQRSTNLLPLRPHVLHVHVGHAPLRVRKQWAAASHLTAMAQIMNFPSLSNAYNQSVWWRWKDYSALIFLLISGPLCRFSKLNSSFNGTLLCFHHSPSQKCHQSFWKKTLTSQNHLHAKNSRDKNLVESLWKWGFSCELFISRSRAAILESE